MDIAILIYDSENGIERKVVTASELREMGKAAARELRFVCAQKDCGISMLPVFPEAVKNGKVLECHFRAHPGTYHKGHGTRQPPASGANTSSDESISTEKKPSGWRDPTEPKKQATSAESAGNDSSEDGERATKLSGVKTTATVSLTKPTKTSLLSKLVERWESEKSELEHEPFDLPGRKNVTWGDIFVRIRSNKFALELTEQRRCIFFGEISIVRAWGAKAFEIEFAGQASERPVICYLKMPPDKKKKHPVLASCLERQTRTANGRAYILGRIKNWSAGPIKIEVESCEYIWAID